MSVQGIQSLLDSLWEGEMAKDDIYGSKAKYERFMGSLDELLSPGVKPKRGKARKYFCRFRSNLKYFREFHREFESRDTSYVRRLRIFCTLLFLVHYAEVDLKELGRKGIDRIMSRAHAVNKSIESKKTIIWNIKFIWRILFPDKDSLGREDETIVPYVVRHLRATVDRSQQTLRPDRLTWDELVQILEYFSGKPMVQAYIALSIESLGRPQELCFRRLKDVEIHDNFRSNFRRR